MNRTVKAITGTLACLGVAMFLIPGAAAGPALKPSLKALYGVVSGVVYDLHGLQVPQARVTIFPTGAAKPIARGYTNEKGVFLYKLPPGLYEVHAGWREFPSGKAVFKVTASQVTVMKVTIAEKLE